ncbi:hypothetical protein [Streptomyces sp. NPDC005125]
MRVRVSSTALGVTAAALLAMSACSTGTTGAKPDTVSPPDLDSRPGPPGAPLRCRRPRWRLACSTRATSAIPTLRKPQRPSQHDDVTVVVLPALSELGADAATGGSLTFPRKAKTTFTYAGSSNSEVSEELYSDSVNKLSTGIRRIFDAMTSCPTYQVVAGGTPIDMASQKLTPPRELGDEQCRRSGYSFACLRNNARSLSRTKGTPCGCWLASAASGTGER